MEAPFGEDPERRRVCEGGQAARLATGGSGSTDEVATNAPTGRLAQAIAQDAADAEHPYSRPGRSNAGGRPASRDEPWSYLPATFLAGFVRELALQQRKAPEWTIPFGSNGPGASVVGRNDWRSNVGLIPHRLGPIGTAASPEAASARMDLGNQ